MMNIQEDPWDNYLYYDSKYALPIICHGNDQPIERQVLLSMFIQKSMSDETISQYKLQGGKLVFALINFVEKEFDYDEMANNFADADDDDDIDNLLNPTKNQSTLLQKIKEGCNSPQRLNQPEIAKIVSEVDRAFKMFYLHMQM